MTLFVYVADSCWSDARTHGLSDEVERFKERVESSQSTSLFDPFPPPYLVKKKLGGRQGRLVTQQENVGEHSVVVFLAVMIRGNREYEEFSDDPKGYGAARFAGMADQALLEQYVLERTRAAPVPVKPVPTDIEYSLLFDAFSHRDESSADVIVCETEYWVETVMQDRVAKHLSVLHRPCLIALAEEAGLRFIPAEGKGGWGIWALRKDDRLLLIAPSTDTSAQQAEELSRRVASELEAADATAVLRASRRAYPALVLADDDLWIDLEREPVANIALSPEESEVLESARRSPHPFPLFINGRAGSGKSTILQYLFADVLFNYLSRTEARSIAPPIYLTASGELLRVARRFVEQLLKSEATFAQRPIEMANTDSATLLDQAFMQFQSYVLSRIPKKIRMDEFAGANRVDYARFRSLWTERFGKDRHAVRDYGPDLSWHVIRSYIKGLSSESYLEPEDYAQLPENQLTVTEESYRAIYDRVWTGWYRDLLEARGLWDDQDLTRYALDNNLAQPLHPAVLCDEAQDFTRIELEFLLRINLFSGRTLPPTELARVCFAFAGDQFQTLNPTGFRWDAIKATFVEKFIFELDAGRRGGRTDLNYRELQYNYRSSDKIVRFGNHVQALRAALFQLPDLRPQKPWTTAKRAFPVTWFRAGDAAFWEKFRENPGIVVIVPCHEEEEAEFVRNDAFLSQYIHIEDGVPQNVLSASRAKGCEYPAVIVYGFGQEAHIDVVEELGRDAKETDQTAERILPLQYFVNRLYVAVSRPKRRLIVVDTDEGLERLWKAATDETAESELVARLKRGPEVWQPAIEGMLAGNVAELGRDDAVDPVENARSFEGEGLVRRDSFLMKQAAQAYRGAGEIAKARECRARALEFEGELLEAGTAFVEAGRAIPDAIRCLWRAGAEGRAKLAQLPLLEPSVAGEIEVRCAQLLQGKPEAQNAIDLLQRLVSRLDDTEFFEQSVGTPQWREALGQLIKKAVKEPAQPFAADEWHQFTLQLDRLGQHGIAVPPIDAASAYFAAGKYADAIRLWEEAGATRGPEYTRARAESEPYPKRVMPLAVLKRWEEIVHEFDRAPDTLLTAEQAGFVATALREMQRPADAYVLAWKSRNADGLFRVALEVRETDATLAAKAVHGALIALVHQGRWDDIAALLQPSAFRPIPEWHGDAVGSWFTSMREPALGTLVRALARESRFQEAPEIFQKQWQDFLRDRLRVKEGRWRQFVSVEEAGAAFERAGRFTDAIGFYEALRGQRHTEEETLFAKTRWLVCKNRQLLHERAGGESGKTRKIEREISDEAKRLKVRSIEALDEYPILTEIDNPDLGPTSPRPQTTAAPTAETGPVMAAMSGEVDRTERPARLIAAVGHFQLQLARNLGRLNITHTGTMETAFIKLASREFGGEKHFEATAGEWVCGDWKMRVRMPSDTQRAITVTMSDLGGSVCLDLD